MRSKQQQKQISRIFYFLCGQRCFCLLFNYLIFGDVEITEIDLKNFKIKAIGFGEEFDLKKHPKGTEVKAITYSAMKIVQKQDRVDCYVVVDI